MEHVVPTCAGAVRVKCGAFRKMLTLSEPSSKLATTVVRYKFVTRQLPTKSRRKKEANLWVRSDGGGVASSVGRGDPVCQGTRAARVTSAGGGRGREGDLLFNS